MIKIWPKQNKVCFQKKLEIWIIWSQNVSNGSIVGNGGGDGDVGLGGGSGGDASGGGDGGGGEVIVVVGK